MSKNTEAVKVVVRCRPINEKEKMDNRKQIVQMDVREGQVSLFNPKTDGAEPPKIFTYDQVYDSNTAQREIFDITAQPIVEASMEGYNGTIFAYGQTGTGKSHTMEGKDEPPELRGIIPNTFVHIFDRIAAESGKKEFLVRVSYLEIYNEEIRDLLGANPQKKLELKETVDKGVFVKELTQIMVKGSAEMNAVLQVGKRNRSTGATLMNQDSSRSHSIFTITIETTEHIDMETAGGTASAAASGGGGSAAGNGKIRAGKLNLVDLAGSERQSKTGATGDRLKEGIKINLSLTALGNVISALVDSKTDHIPYRDSKLTRLLQDSLGGNTKTVMVANIGPADWNYDETLSTLRYANRAKNIKNKPRINEDPKDAMLREYTEEIARLKQQLQDKGGDRKVVERVQEVAPSAERVNAIKEQMRRDLAEKLKADMGQEALQAAKDEAEAHARAALEAVMAAQESTEEQKRLAKEALGKLHEEEEAVSKDIQQEAQEAEGLRSKLEAMQSKIVHGGENLLDKVDQLKKEAKDMKMQLEVQRRQEEEARRRARELEDAQGDLSVKYSSLEEEVQHKSRKLKKLYANYQAKKSEAKDLGKQFQLEREAILEDIRGLTQQIKLKDLIIASFIPPEFQQKIMQHCHWMDYEQTWVIDMVQYAGNAMRARKEMAAAEVERSKGSSPHKEDESALAHVFFSYKQLEEAHHESSSPARPASAARRPGSARRSRASAVQDSGSDLRESVERWKGEERRAQEATFPQARGLVGK